MSTTARFGWGGEKVPKQLAFFLEKKNIYPSVDVGWALQAAKPVDLYLEVRKSLSVLFCRWNMTRTFSVVFVLFVLVGWLFVWLFEKC